MKMINNHVLDVYQRRGALYVTASLSHSGGGVRSLDFALTVEGGWDALPAALRTAEDRALEALVLPESQRRFGRDDELVRAAGCKSYPEFVNGTVACSVVRLDDECVAQVWTPNARADGFGKRDEEFPCDPKTPIEELAPLVRKAIESA